MPVPLPTRNLQKYVLTISLLSKALKEWIRVNRSIPSVPTSPSPPPFKPHLQALMLFAVPPTFPKNWVDVDSAEDVEVLNSLPFLQLPEIKTFSIQTKKLDGVAKPIDLTPFITKTAGQEDETILGYSYTVSPYGFEILSWAPPSSPGPRVAIGMVTFTFPTSAHMANTETYHQSSSVYRLGALLRSYATLMADPILEEAYHPCFRQMAQEHAHVFADRVDASLVARSCSTPYKKDTHMFWDHMGSRRPIPTGDGSFSHAIHAMECGGHADSGTNLEDRQARFYCIHKDPATSQTLYFQPDFLLCDAAPEQAFQYVTGGVLTLDEAGMAFDDAHVTPILMQLTHTVFQHYLKTCCDCTTERIVRFEDDLPRTPLLILIVGSKEEQTSLQKTLLGHAYFSPKGDVYTSGIPAKGNPHIQVLTDVKAAVDYGLAVKTQHQRLKNVGRMDVFYTLTILITLDPSVVSSSDAPDHYEQTTASFTALPPHFELIGLTAVRTGLMNNYSADLVHTLLYETFGNQWAAFKSGQGHPVSVWAIHVLTDKLHNVWQKCASLISLAGASWFPPHWIDTFRFVSNRQGDVDIDFSHLNAQLFDPVGPRGFAAGFTGSAKPRIVHAASLFWMNRFLSTTCFPVFRSDPCFHFLAPETPDCVVHACTKIPPPSHVAKLPLAMPGRLAKKGVDLSPSPTSAAVQALVSLTSFSSTLESKQDEGSPQRPRARKGLPGQKQPQKEPRHPYLALKGVKRPPGSKGIKTFRSKSKSSGLGVGKSPSSYVLPESDSDATDEEESADETESDVCSDEEKDVAPTLQQFTENVAKASAQNPGSDVPYVWTAAGTPVDVSPSISSSPLSRKRTYEQSSPDVSPVDSVTSTSSSSSSTSLSLPLKSLRLDGFDFNKHAADWTLHYVPAPLENPLLQQLYSQLLHQVRRTYTERVARQVGEYSQERLFWKCMLPLFALLTPGLISHNPTIKVKTTVDSFATLPSNVCGLCNQSVLESTENKEIWYQLYSPLKNERKQPALPDLVFMSCGHAMHTSCLKTSNPKASILARLENDDKSYDAVWSEGQGSTVEFQCPSCIRTHENPAFQTAHSLSKELRLTKDLFKANVQGGPAVVPGGLNVLRVYPNNWLQLPSDSYTCPFSATVVAAKWFAFLDLALQIYKTDPLCHFMLVSACPLPSTFTHTNTQGGDSQEDQEKNVALRDILVHRLDLVDCQHHINPQGLKIEGEKLLHTYVILMDHGALDNPLLPLISSYFTTAPPHLYQLFTPQTIEERTVAIQKELYGWNAADGSEAAFNVQTHDLVASFSEQFPDPEKFVFSFSFASQFLLNSQFKSFVLKPVPVPDPVMEPSEAPKEGAPASEPAVEGQHKPAPMEDTTTQETPQTTFTPTHQTAQDHDHIMAFDFIHTLSPRLEGQALPPAFVFPPEFEFDMF